MLDLARLEPAAWRRVGNVSGSTRLGVSPKWIVLNGQPTPMLTVRANVPAVREAS